MPYLINFRKRFLQIGHSTRFPIYASRNTFLAMGRVALYIGFIIILNPDLNDLPLSVQQVSLVNSGSGFDSIKVEKNSQRDGGFRRSYDDNENRCDLPVDVSG